MNFQLIGVNHHTAPVEVRERLAIGQRHLAAVPSPAPEPLPVMPPTPVGGRIPMSTAGTPKPTPANRPEPRRMPTPAELFGRPPKPKPEPEPPKDEDDDTDPGTELATGTG